MNNESDDSEGERPRIVPPNDWGSTGVSVPDLSGEYHLPAGTNGDEDRRRLLASAVASLYSVVGSAQRYDAQSDETRHAVHQLLVSNAAIAASEGDAFLTLVSAALEAPSLVHLRAVGETTRRISICREYPGLALAIYRTARPAWIRMAHRVGIEGIPEIDRAERDMRALENTQEFKDAKNDVVARFHLMNDDEWTAWSKRSHGDVLALMQVSQNLRNRGSDVRCAVNSELPSAIAANGYLMRAIGFVLFALAHLCDEFSVDTRGNLKRIAEAYSRMQRRDDETGALRVRPQCAE